jgi:hypothetical protein
MDWFQRQFAAIAASIDFTPVEEKLDEVNENVADVKTAVEHIDMSATEERIMGGKLPLNSGESVPAFIGDGDLSDVNDMNEDGELYTYSAMQLPETVAVGDVFTAGSFQEQTEGMFFLAKAANDPSLYYDGQDFSVSGITEKLEVQAGKSYIVTGVYELHYEDEGYGVEASGLLLTYDEYEQGRSVREVYKKLDELDVHDENAKHLAQFFGVTLVEGYEFMTDTEVCDELEDIMQVIDPDLTAEQAAAITAQTLNPSES